MIKKTKGKDKMAVERRKLMAVKKYMLPQEDSEEDTEDRSGEAMEEKGAA